MSTRKACQFFVFHQDIYASHLYLFLTVVHVISGIVSSGLNGLVIRTIWKSPSLHKPSMILIAGLSLKDFCMGSLVEPAYTTWIITAQKAESFKLFCIMGMVSKSVLYGLTTVAGFNITAISFDRCLAVRSKAKYRSLITVKRVIKFLIFAWASSFIIAVSLNFESKTNVFRAVAILGVIFFIVSKTCYIISIMTLRKLRKQVTQAPANKETTAKSETFNITKYSRSLKTLFVVVCFDVLFYCPLIAIAIFQGLGIEISDKDWEMYLSICEMLMFLPSCANPCIFLWRMQDLRQEARDSVKNFFKRS